MFPEKKPSILIIRLCLASLLCLPLLAQETTQAWPAFRGPTLNGHSPVSGVLQGKQHLSLNKDWTIALGSGYSGVVVADGVAVTMHSDEKNNLIAAFKADDGTKMWEHPTGDLYKGHDGSHDGPIATPLVHDGRVFTLDTAGTLFAFDLKSGKTLWTKNFTEEYKAQQPYYGFGASPIFIDGVLVSLIGGENQAIGGFDPKTGESLWKVGTDQVNFQGLMPWKWFDQDILLAAGQTKLFGINAKKGELLWEFGHEGQGGRGATSLVPVPAGPNHLFLANHDQHSIMVEIGRDNAGKAVLNKVWQERSIRNSYNVPVYYQGRLYAYSSRFLTCVDTADGKMLWRSRPPGDGFLILVDGHLVIAAKDGTVNIITAHDKGYEEKAAVKITDSLNWSHPAFADNRIFVRSLDGLTRITISDAPAVAGDGQSEAPKGSNFASFLAKVKNAKKPAKQQKLVDAFMADIKQTPIWEDGGWVHFVYQGDNKDVAIGGDLFGARQEQGMHRLAETNLFYYSTQLDPDAMVAYLFILDYKDMIADPKNPNKTETTMLGKDMEMSFGPDSQPMSWVAGPKWAPPAFVGKSGDKKGAMAEHSFESKTLEGKVVVQVYTPHGYSDSDTYPLAVVHGGKAALERGDWQKSLNTLIGDKVAPTVVAFVTESPRAQAYPAMVTNELLPLLTEKYRISEKPEQRANIGFGMTGATAIMVTISNPDKFAKYGTHSAMILDYIFPMVKGPLEKLTDEQKASFKAYMDWGRYEFRNPQEAWDLKVYNQRFTKMLDQQGLTTKAEEFPEGTDWTSWRHRTEKMLHNLFPLQGSQM